MLSKYKYCITGKLGRCPFSKVLMSHQRAHIEFWHRRLALSIVCESANPWVIGWQMIRSYRIFLSFPFSVQHFGTFENAVICWTLSEWSGEVWMFYRFLNSILDIYMQTFLYVNFIMVYRSKIRHIYLRLKDVSRKEEASNVYLYFKTSLFSFLIAPNSPELSKIKVIYMW